MVLGLYAHNFHLKTSRQTSKIWKKPLKCLLTPKIFFNAKLIEPTFLYRLVESVYKTSPMGGRYPIRNLPPFLNISSFNLRFPHPFPTNVHDSSPALSTNLSINHLCSFTDHVPFPCALLEALWWRLRVHLDLQRSGRPVLYSWKRNNMNTVANEWPKFSDQVTLSVIAYAYLLVKTAWVYCIPELATSIL